jgi:hypothetical protein
MRCFVLSPFVYYPLFYIFKDVAAGCFQLRSSISQYRSEFWPQMRLLWAFWFPANLISFTVVPTHLRVAFSAFVGTVWVFALSMKTHLLSTMGSACATSEATCALPEPTDAMGEQARTSMPQMVGKNWIFVASFLVLQAATGTMLSVGALWLSLLLYSGWQDGPDDITALTAGV